ncbi:MAG TPA: hypothetical protein VJ044_01345 [Candidatus Hodarchaeales archaeon]|nr:hypothetical protein [Candidatus Hodarchaeales archaeon]
MRVNSNLEHNKGFMSYVVINLVVLAQERKIDSILSFDEHFEKFLMRVS